jgi:hypothetical protein
MEGFKLNCPEVLNLKAELAAPIDERAPADIELLGDAVKG